MDSRFSFPLMLVVIVNLICAAAAAAAAADEASMAAGVTQIRSDLVGGSCTMDSEFAGKIARVEGFPEMRCFRCVADSTPSGGPSAGAGPGAAEPNLPVMYCTQGRCQPSLPPRSDDEAGELCGSRQGRTRIHLTHLSSMLREMNRTGIKRVIFEHFETVTMPVNGGLLPALGDSSLSFSNVRHFEVLDYLFSILQEIEVRGILTLTDSEIRMTNVTTGSVPLLTMGGNGGSVSAERSSFVRFPGCPHEYTQEAKKRINTLPSCRELPPSCRGKLFGLENDSEEIRYSNITAYMSNITELKGCSRQDGRIRVEMLDLNEVNIGTIPEGAFRRTSVGKMRITNSSIGTIKQGSFDSLSLGRSLQFLGNRVSKLGGNVFRHLGNSDTQPAENVTVTMLCNSFNISEVSSFDVERDGRVRLELDGNDVRIGCGACEDLENTTLYPVPTDVRRPPPSIFQCAGMQCGPTSSSSSGAYSGQLEVGDGLEPPRKQGALGRCRPGSPGIEFRKKSEDLYPYYRLLIPLVAAILLLLLLLLMLPVARCLYKRRQSRMAISPPVPYLPSWRKDNRLNAEAGKCPNSPEAQQEDDNPYIELAENIYAEPCEATVPVYQNVAEPRGNPDAETCSRQLQSSNSQKSDAITANRRIESIYMQAIP